MITSLERQKRIDEERVKDIGITIRQVGIGDGVQFTSLPQNYFKATGHKLIDVSQPWYFDHNPYVLRNVKPAQLKELWNYPKLYEFPKVRPNVYMTNAEIHCAVLGIKNPHLIRPKLYRFEHFPFSERKEILFHPFGRSHGSLPRKVILHILNKYKDSNLVQIGLEKDPDLGIQRHVTPNLWSLTEVISKARMLIGIDSGPSWIASCYPDVQIKKIRTKFQFGYCEPKDWVPLWYDNPHSYWDDRGLFKIYNCFEEDVGFTESYLKL